MSEHKADHGAVSTPGNLNSSASNDTSVQRLVEYFLVISCAPQRTLATPKKADKLTTPQRVRRSVSTTGSVASSKSERKQLLSPAPATPTPSTPSRLNVRSTKPNQMQSKGQSKTQPQKQPGTTSKRPKNEVSDATLRTPARSNRSGGNANNPSTTTKERFGGTMDFSRSIQASAKKLSKSMKNPFRKREVSGSVQAINASFSLDTQDSDQLEEEVVQPPKPRGKWSKEEDISGTITEERSRSAEPAMTTTHGNIHVGLGADGKPNGAVDGYRFQPRITARYPSTDHQASPLNPMVTQFCFPNGEHVEPTMKYELPQVSHFVLTDDKGRKLYGTCLTFYEEYRPSAGDPWRQASLIHDASSAGNVEVSVNAEAPPVYIPKCLCILSIWPYVRAFREYLAQLYRLATSTNVMVAPIERYIMNLCAEIPAPPPGAFEVRINILDSTIRFWAPPAKLPIAYVALPYQVLFDCLDTENILHLWYCLVMERKILLVSSQYSLLTICAEILGSLLFPMEWTHLYVPMLPRFLCPMLDAPVPYLCGVTRDNWLCAQQNLNEETIVVDLDRNSLLFGQATPPLPPLPGKKWSKLQSALEDTAGHLFWKTRGLEQEYKQVTSNKLSFWKFKSMCRDKGDTRWKEKLHTYDHAFNLQFTPDSENIVDEEAIMKDQSQWDTVQEAFLRFFVAVLKDYRKFLDMPKDDSPLSPIPGSSEWMTWSMRRSFDRDGFIASQKPEYEDFLTEMCMTQQFDSFMTKRLYSPGLPDIIFFDQSIDAKLNRSRLKLRKVETPFLQSAKTHKALTKFQAIQPNEADLPKHFTDSTTDGKHSTYKSWPDAFDETLFAEPRPIPKMITAEFDRQAALVSHLRAMSPLKEHGDKNLFLGGDYDSMSEEAMSFTVFFFAYTAVIGREWEQFQRKRRELKMETIVDDETFHLGTSPSINASATSVTAATVATSDTAATSTDTVAVVATDAATVSPITDAASTSAVDAKAADAKGANIADETKEQKEDDYDVFQLSKTNLDDLTFRTMCEPCPDGGAVSNAVVYVTTSPCPQGYIDEINTQAQHAYDVISKFTLSPHEQRGTSLLDTDEHVAEYEEARDVATAQLDLAMDTLKIMEARGLASNSDLFKSLMAACGRCGDTKRALELIDAMKKEGLVPDKEVLTCFMEAFAHHEGNGTKDSPKRDQFVRSRTSDAYATFLKRKLNSAGGDATASTTQTGAISSSDEEGSDFMSDASSDGASVTSNRESYLQSAISTSMLDWLTPHKKQQTEINNRRRRRYRRRKKRKAKKKLPVSDHLEKQIILGESLLDFLYPGLSIDLSGDSCPRCSNAMEESHIIAGWKPCEFQDFTTTCPQCNHKFVPRFSVSCTSPTFMGSQGAGTQLYCEFLSPWVLRKELHPLVSGENGGEAILDPEWRGQADIRATLWWNLIVLCKRNKLPFTFLLQGSFQNRLINPVPAG